MRYFLILSVLMRATSLHVLFCFGFSWKADLPSVAVVPGGNTVRFCFNTFRILRKQAVIASSSSSEKQQVFVRRFIERIVCVISGHAVKDLASPDSSMLLVAVPCHFAHTLFSMRCRPRYALRIFGHHAQHIRASPRAVSLVVFTGYGYRAPGNIFINQLHRLPSLGQFVSEVPSSPVFFCI